MCIRDRPYINAFRGKTFVIAFGGKAVASEFAKTLAYDVNPVSYTHLRAHETVLDLVCRLLLAKKKLTQQTINNILQILLKSTHTVTTT